MNIKSVNILCFSPNGTTKDTLENIGEGFEIPVNFIDLTPFRARWKKHHFEKDDLVILGLPTYGGRLPKIMEEFKRDITTDGSPCVYVVTYGNREYEDALLELKNIGEGLGFKSIAGGAFIAEHCVNKNIATNRPDEKDKEKHIEFCKKIKSILKNIEQIDSLGQLNVPGNFPYIAQGSEAPFAPTTIEGSDVSKVQASVCPVLAINPDDQNETDVKRCILCYRCINLYPDIKECNVKPYLDRMKVIEKLNSERKEPEMFYID